MLKWLSQKVLRTVLPRQGRASAFDFQNDINSVAHHIATAVDQEPAGTFCFLAPQPAQGVSTIVSELARALTRYEPRKRIIVADANFANANLTALFGASSRRGLAAALQGEIAAEEALLPLSDGACWLLPMERAPIDAGLLSFAAVKKLLASLRCRADCVLIDSQPLANGPASISLARACDRTYLVVTPNSLHVKAARHWIETLRAQECTVHGVILNRVLRPVPDWLYQRL